MRFALQQKKMNRIRKMAFHKNLCYFMSVITTLCCIAHIIKLTTLVGEYEVYDMVSKSTLLIVSKIITGVISYIMDKRYWRLLAEDCAVYPFETSKIL